MTEHYIQKCKHGTVMGQCRCPGPKSEFIVACGPPCVHTEQPERTEAAEESARRIRAASRARLSRWGHPSDEERIKKLEAELTALRMEFDKLKARLDENERLKERVEWLEKELADSPISQSRLLAMWPDPLPGHETPDAQ